MAALCLVVDALCLRKPCDGHAVSWKALWWTHCALGSLAMDTLHVEVGSLYVGALRSRWQQYVIVDSLDAGACCSRHFRCLGWTTRDRAAVHWWALEQEAKQDA